MLWSGFPVAPKCTVGRDWGRKGSGKMGVLELHDGNKMIIFKTPVLRMEREIRVG